MSVFNLPFWESQTRWDIYGVFKVKFWKDTMMEAELL